MRMIKLKNTGKTRVGKDMEKEELLHSTVMHINQFKHLAKLFSKIQ